MSFRLLHIGALLGAAAIAVTLWAWGQPLISASGEVRLWIGSIWSSENSQQIADWYSLSHLIHGMLVVLLGRPLQRWIGGAAIYAIAIITGVAWEIVEHTDWVLGQFRDTTIYQGYIGDSVLNAVCDYVFMLSGFALASALPTAAVAVLALVVEVTSALVARDSLTLTTLHLVHPVPAIDAWQAAINPRGATSQPAP